MSFSEEERQEFERLMSDVLKNRMVTNFVFVAEMASNDGAEVEIYLSQAMTPWLAHGMLDYANQVIAYQVYEASGDEEEDEN